MVPAHAALCRHGFASCNERRTEVLPAKYKNTYRNWLENIKDWCISRQLWWGHRIPAYYLPEGGFVVAETPEKALELAKEKTGNQNLKVEDLRQDDDCLDTWFSSWLWPISLFDGINNPGNEEIKYYYPTSDLVTGPDIIFFWVARMIMAGYEYMAICRLRMYISLVSYVIRLDARCQNHWVTHPIRWI